MCAIRAEHGQLKYGVYDFICDTADDFLGTPKSGVLPGSTVFIVDESIKYMLNTNNEWVEITTGNKPLSEEEKEAQHAREDGYIERTLTDYTNDTLTTIGSYAFYDFDQLKSIDCKKAEAVGNFAFSLCSNLTTVTLPKVTTIGMYAFSSCSALTTICVPKLTSLGTNNSIFQGCTALITVNFPSLATFCRTAFTNTFTGLQKISFGQSLTFPLNALYYKTKLTTVICEKKCTFNGGAFRNCSQLTSLVLKDTKNISTLTSTTAFQNTSSNLKIYVPSSLLTKYKTATNWSRFYSRIRPLEEFEEE